MLLALWDHTRRWRTWIFNLGVALALGIGALLSAFDGFDWSAVLPSPWDRIALIAVVLGNVLLRPRAAVLPHEVDGTRANWRRRQRK